MTSAALILILLQLLLVPAAIVGLYWLIRLAVRHGVQDAQRRKDKTGPYPLWWTQGKPREIL